jgi:hypothetical protein
MKKTIISRFIGIMIAIVLVITVISWSRYLPKKPTYRDLNKNGRMDVTQSDYFVEERQ